MKLAVTMWLLFAAARRRALLCVPLRCAGGVACGPDYTPTGQADLSKPDRQAGSP